MPNQSAGCGARRSGPAPKSRRNWVVASSISAGDRLRMIVSPVASSDGGVEHRSSCSRPRCSCRPAAPRPSSAAALAPRWPAPAWARRWRPARSPRPAARARDCPRSPGRSPGAGRSCLPISRVMARPIVPHASSAARSSAAGSGRRVAASAAATAGSTVTASASAIACGRSSTVMAGGVGSWRRRGERDGGHQQPGDERAEQHPEHGGRQAEQQFLQAQLHGRLASGHAERGQQRRLAAAAAHVGRDRHPEPGDRQHRRRRGHRQQRLLRRGRQGVARGGRGQPRPRW